MTPMKPLGSQKSRFVNSIFTSSNQANFEAEISFKGGELSHPKFLIENVVKL